MTQPDQKRATWDRADKITFLVVSGIGLATWLGVALFYGVREAWDAPAFFPIAVPLMIVVPGIAGAIRPNTFPLWGFAFVLPWPIAMMIMSPISDAFGGGLFFMVILGVFSTLGAFAGWCLRMISDWVRRKV